MEELSGYFLTDPKVISQEEWKIMKKLQVLLMTGAMVFMLSSCGQTKNTEEQTGIMSDIPQSSTATDKTNSDETPSVAENWDLSEADGKDTQQGEINQSEAVTAREQSDPAVKENNDIELEDKLEVDFTYDYSEDIKADVDRVVSGSASLQEELENIEKVIQKYTPLAEAAQTQGEMNVSSQWFLVIWDTELNSLWNRFSNLADQQTKENVLADQRNWISMKEEVVYENIGSSEENGSMYPLLVNTFMEEMTKNRAYVLANELAKVTGESFVMPEKSAKYGTFVDNQGTGSVYSSLVTRQGLSEEDEAIISLFRLGEIKGTFVDNGNGELVFTSDTWKNVKGIIRINGWDGASFKVTEAPSDSPVSVGEEFTFPFAF